MAEPGLLKKGMAQAMGGGQPPEPMGSQAAMQGNMADANGVENVSGQEQAEYERGMAAAMKLIHGDQNSQSSIIQSLKTSAKNPVGAVAQAAVEVIKTVDQKINLGETVIMPMLEEVVPLIVEAGTEARVLKMSPKQVEQALATASEMLLDEYGVDEESFNQVNSTVNPDEMAATYQSTLQGA